MEGSLPDDRKLLLKIAGCTAEAEAEHLVSTGQALPEHSLSTARARLGHSLSTVLALFRHDDSTHRYRHAKVDEVMPKLVSYHEQKSHAGIRSGQARRERALNDRSEQKPQTDKPSPAPDPAPTPDPEQTPISPAPDGALFDLSATPNGNGNHRTKRIHEVTPQQKIWFQAWWDIYWLRKAREDAEKAFFRVVRTKEMFVRIMKATREQTPYEMAKSDPHGRPYGATWLNGKRWTDDVIAPVSSSQKAHDDHAEAAERAKKIFEAQSEQRRREREQRDAELERRRALQQRQAEL